MEEKQLWFESHGTRLFAVESGAGKPLILLHGGLANYTACRVFAAALDARYRVVTPDLRASGRSIFRDALTWDLIADDVAALVHALGVDRAIIGGVSGGAGAAVAAALKHPAIVEALLVLNPAYGGAELGLLPAQQMAMNAMDAAGSRAPAEGVDVLLPLFDALPEAIRARARALVAGYDAQSVAATTKFLASGAQPFARGRDLAAITAPTLLVPGIDPYHPREVADVYAKNVPGVVVREATPAEYGTVIADFLQSA
jgi:pimeloyl-ACP methyl ester carboxylesterase